MIAPVTTAVQAKTLLAGVQGPHMRRLARALLSHERPSVRAAAQEALRRDSRRLEEVLRTRDLYRLEDSCRRAGEYLVAGIDEVGRGALAGPLTVAACVLPMHPRILGLNDSKLLRPTRRVQLAEVIKRVCRGYRVVHVPAAQVDELGLSAALKMAMRTALAELELPVDRVLLDGLPLGIHPNETAIVKGDGRIAAIAAASILAKVERDGLMVELAHDHPEYSLEINKGYGTPEHLAAIASHGPTTVHRRSFAPCVDQDRLF